MTFAQYVDKAEERSGRWQAKACPTIAGTRPAGVGHALACLAHLLLLALGSAAMLYAQTANTCSCGANPPGPPPNREQHPRSEEHTSELQSLRHLVCRLLLEKKKNTG